MSSIVEWIDQSLYPTYSRNWDDRLFRERILRHVDSQKSVLDLGAGAGIVTEMNFRGLAKQVCGVDLDPRVVSNPMLDEGRVADAGKIPYPDQKFDVVFADNVMEHIDDPILVFREVHRVLKGGGGIPIQDPK